MRLLGTLPLLLLLTSCGTNYNDVMSQWVQSQKEVAQINAQRDIEVARAKAQETLAMVNADPGGTTITDPVSGFVTEVKNPNPYFYANSGFVTKSGANSLQKPTTFPMPQKRVSWWEKGLGYTAGILDKTINVALNNAAGVFSIVEQNKTQRAIAEYNYLSDSAMFSTMGGFGQNMENTASNAITGMSTVATTATNDMQLLGSNALEQMQILGSNNANANATMVGHTMGAIRDIATSAFENPLTNTFIQTNSESSIYSSEYEEIIPEWFGQPTTNP